MAELKNLNENFILIGEVIINKNQDKYVTTKAVGKNGWMKKSINLGVKISDLNKIYVGMEAGFWSDETIEKTKNETGKDERGKDKRKQNWIYNGETDDNGNWVADNIPFDKRFDQEMIDKVPYYKKIRVALEPEIVKMNGNNGELVNQVNVDSDGNAIYANKEFLFAGDAIDYIKKHLKNNQKIYIYGHTEINQYINKQGELTTRFNRIIDQIRVAKKDEENQAVGTTNFYFTKDSFDKSEFKHDKKYYIFGHRTYKNNEKKIVPVPVTYILDFSNPNVDWENEEIKERVEYLVNVFNEGIKKDKVYLTTWRYMIFEGNEEVELTEKDLSKSLKKRVKLGFISLENAIKQMRGSSVGDKIKELKLVMPLGEDDKTLMEDYTLEDLIPPAIENKANKVEEQIKKEKEEKEEETKKNITKSFDDMFK